MEEQGVRKVDQVVREWSADWGKFFVLDFHEIKRNEISNAELEYVETQAYTACESYCKKHGVGKVYAQTSVGSRARFFRYQPGSWNPLDTSPLASWDAYYEFGDAAGEKYILETLDFIKREGATVPTPYVGSLYFTQELIRF
jgi:hypothetical protein